MLAQIEWKLKVLTSSFQKKTKKNLEMLRHDFKNQEPSVQKAVYG
jgi:hypothetical protein